MSISKNEVIDPTFKGNLARFINHSCDPNCETQKWHVLGEICVGIFTLRDVDEGEELTFNYGFDILKTTFQKCLCKSKNCKGYLGVAQNEVSAPIQNIFCFKCNKNCRNNDPILVCEKCKKIYHKVCLKPKQIQLIDGSHFFCKVCVGKNEKKIARERAKNKRGLIVDNEDKTNMEINNVINSLKDLNNPIKVENTDIPVVDYNLAVALNIEQIDKNNPTVQSQFESAVSEVHVASIEDIIENNIKEEEEVESEKSEDPNDEVQNLDNITINKFNSSINEEVLKGIILEESNEKIDEIFEVDENQLNTILKNLRV